MLIAWLILSNATEDTVWYFFQLVYSVLPSVAPKYFMSDKDQAQLNTMATVYPDLALNLCWWHVLYTWQQYFSITAFPDLWVHLKKWVRITSKNKF
jgi:hypothetical protein